MKLASPPRMALVALLAMTSAAQAAYITGSINFSSGDGGGIILQDSAGNMTTNLALARGIQSWLVPEVEEGTGSLDTVPDGTSVTFSQPWVFSPSTPMSPLWTIAGPENFTFHLSSSTVLFQNGYFLGVRGTGTLTGTGYDATPASWYFTTQGVATQGKFSWSSSTFALPVPDGGTTLSIFGGSLLALGGLRRKLCGR